LGRHASTEFDPAVAANLRRLAEELARDQADLTPINSLPGDVDLAQGKIAMAEAVAATAALAEALRGASGRQEK
jgi:hypothetical protein